MACMAARLMYSGVGRLDSPKYSRSTPSMDMAISASSRMRECGTRSTECERWGIENYCDRLRIYTGGMNRRTAVFSIAGVVALFADDKQPKKLTDAELEKLLQDEKNLFFLDVREPKEIQELGSIKGYVNIPLGQLESRLGEIPKDKLIVTA